MEDIVLLPLHYFRYICHCWLLYNYEVMGFLFTLESSIWIILNCAILCGYSICGVMAIFVQTRFAWCISLVLTWRIPIVIWFFIVFYHVILNFAQFCCISYCFWDKGQFSFPRSCALEGSCSSIVKLVNPKGSIICSVFLCLLWFKR